MKPPSSRSSRGLVTAGALLGALFLLLLVYVSRSRSLTGINDFLPNYAAAALLGHGDIYSPDENRRVQLESTGALVEFHYIRLPFHAVLLKPLALMPYLPAYALFSALSLGAVVAFVMAFRKQCPELPLFVGLSLPVCLSLANGQDSTFVLFFAAAAVILARRGHDVAAGAALSLCAIKYHLFVPVPLVLIAFRKRRMLLGSVGGGVVLMIASFAAAGLDWPKRYLAQLGSEAIHPCPDCMPNTRSLSATLSGGNFAVELALSVLVVVLLILGIRKMPFEPAFGLAIVAGVLVGHHAYTPDCVLLLLSFALLVPHFTRRLPRVLVAFAVLPPTYLLLLSRGLYSAAVPVLLIGLLGAIAFTNDTADGARARA